MYNRARRIQWLEELLSNVELQEVQQKKKKKGESENEKPPQ